MSSLPPRSSSAPYYGSRANLSRPSGAGYPPSKSPYFQYMPGDHSVRSASLTSIVDMYHGRTPYDALQPLRSPSSFYYDYTEEFDKEFPCEFEYASTIGSPQGHTIGILMKDGMEETDAAHPASFKGPSTRDTNTKPRGEQPKEGHLMTSTLALCGSPVLSIDTSEDDWVWEGSQQEKGSGEHDTVRASPPPVPPKTEARCPDKLLLHMGNEAVSVKPKLHGAHHRRTPANTNIKIPNNNDVALPKRDVPLDVPKADIDAGILSPNPISPARQLRVTNSIPQLMKALPPLPDEAQHNSDPHCWSSSRHTAAHAYKMYASSPANNAIRLESKVGPDGTIVRNSPLKQYSSLLELKNFPHRDAFTDRSSFREALEEQLAQFGVDKRLSNIDEGTIRGPSRQLSDQFDIPYPPSTKGIVTAELVSQPKFDSGLGISDRWDFDKTLYSGKNFIRKNFDRSLYSKPMRNKSAFLRHRASPTNVRNRPRGPTNLSDPTPLRSEITQGSSFEDSMLAPSVMFPQRIRNRTRRVKRWAAEAKRAVQALMRRTLSRSQHSDSEG
ncbi:hypothetical protein FPCIR_12202 [Fusarium pseudocircinatum]|uniref:Uncharacterized protein n=1 Tax=Fusarium pseudocircinatum TaxID=56676 RepID=A0A8H5KNW7_9HYPO|nr:hypothetical protein FPCIR_12202 [Fusarium pseudocircinatum]